MTTNKWYFVGHYHYREMRRARTFAIRIETGKEYDTIPCTSLTCSRMVLATNQREAIRRWEQDVQHKHTIGKDGLLYESPEKYRAS